MIAELISLLLLLSFIFPDSPRMIYYFLWLVYYIYVVYQTTDVTNENCKCNLNSILKTVVIIVFGLLIVSSLVLFKSSKSTIEDIIQLNIVLFIIGAIAFYYFYKGLTQNCNCENKHHLERINTVNVFMIVIQLVDFYIRL
jgi:hypothetical protein